MRFDPPAGPGHSQPGSLFVAASVARRIRIAPPYASGVARFDSPSPEEEYRAYEGTMGDPGEDAHPCAREERPLQPSRGDRSDSCPDDETNDCAPVDDPDRQAVPSAVGSGERAGDRTDDEPAADPAPQYPCERHPHQVGIGGADARGRGDPDPRSDLREGRLVAHDCPPERWRQIDSGAPPRRGTRSLRVAGVAPKRP